GEPARHRVVGRARRIRGQCHLFRELRVGGRCREQPDQDRQDDHEVGGTRCRFPPTPLVCVACHHRHLLTWGHPCRFPPNPPHSRCACSHLGRPIAASPHT